MFTLTLLMLVSTPDPLYYSCSDSLRVGECHLAQQAAAAINGCAGRTVLAYALQGELVIKGDQRKGWGTMHPRALPGWELFYPVDEAAASYDPDIRVIQLYISERAGFWPKQIHGALTHELMHALGFSHTQEAFSIMNTPLTENTLTPWDCRRLAAKYGESK